MALPKEPRQKMINIMYLVLTALLALNVSSEILNAFKVVDKSLLNSNTNLNNANSTLYSSLADKVSDPITREKATIWNGHAETAKKLSADMSTYIDGLKKQLKEEAGLKLENGQETFKEDDLEAATRLFGKEGKNLGADLENKLKAYKASMLAIDPASIGKEFATTLSVDGAQATGQDGKPKDFTDAYFHMTPTVAALTLLSKFQNNVKNSENQVVTYCHEQIGKVKVKFDRAAVLVGQSANYVMPGQEIEVTAGVGAFSSVAAPQISINGSGVPVVDGVGKYKFNATAGGGKHSVQVNVRYKDQDGNEKNDTKTIEYTVGTPGGAAVMLDKMNVFYVGVDNPITVGSPAGWDKTTVYLNGSPLSGSGSNRTVRVGSVGTASIKVIADGKPSEFQFRCKRIPDAVFKVGSGKKRMATVEFKNQQYCRAELENFDFDLKYNVVSAIVYFTGSGFNGVQQGTISGGDLGAVKALMSKCQPGSSVSFDNIKISGPDGTRSIDGQTYQLF
jgi:gliding motility-associated protein GldM